jgi:hypothetical protein
MTDEIQRWTLSRAKLLEFFGNMRPSIVAMKHAVVHIIGRGGSRRWAMRAGSLKEWSSCDSVPASALVADKHYDLSRLSAR